MNYKLKHIGINLLMLVLLISQVILTTTHVVFANTSESSSHVTSVVSETTHPNRNDELDDT